MCCHKEIWNGCKYNFSDISEKQIFVREPQRDGIYQVKLSLKGEVSDTIELLLYYHEDFEHTEISGTTFVKSFKLIGVESNRSTVVLNTTIKTAWGPRIKLFGVIEPLDPLASITGHLKVECNFIKEYM